MTAFFETPPTGIPAAFAADLAARVPVLTTPRLTLRAPRIDDFDTYAAIACSPRGRYIGGPMTREAAWLDFAQTAATWLLRGHGIWTVVETGAATPAGFVLIGAEPGDEEHELGFLLTEAAEGRGLATEAATAARDFAWARLHLPALVSYVDDGNTRSTRVAQRLGATRDAAAEARLGPGLQVWRHPAPEARA